MRSRGPKSSAGRTKRSSKTKGASSICFAEQRQQTEHSPELRVLQAEVARDTAGLAKGAAAEWSAEHRAVPGALPEQSAGTSCHPFFRKSGTGLRCAAARWRCSAGTQQPDPRCIVWIGRLRDPMFETAA